MKQRLFLFTAILLALISCSGDNDPDSEKKGGGSSNKDELTVEVYIPVHNTVQTYALTAEDESEIDEVSVLMFNKADNRFIKRLIGTKINNAAGAINGNKKQFNIKIPQDRRYGTVYFLVITNSNTYLSSQTGLLSETNSYTRDYIMDGLSSFYNTDELVLGDKKWPVKPGKFVRFPMFGFSQDINLAQSVITVPPITLIRSIAKIDVGVNFDNNNPAIPRGINPTTDNTFKIESVTVCNAYDRFRHTPYSRNWDGTGVITEPSVAYSNRLNLTYTLLPSERETSANLGMLNKIYITEHEKASYSDDRVNKVLYTIIGGYFTEKGKPENTSKITYYRVDFVKSTKDQNGVISLEPLAILRNHLYRINIVKVLGEGYATVEEAKNSIGNNINNNMMVNVTNNDELINDMVYDGKYMMGVEKSFFKMDYHSATDLKTLVRTTCPQGWKAVVTEGNTWLSLTGGTTVTQTAAGISELKFQVQSNPRSQNRTGKITITSGLMKQVVEVKQFGHNAIETNAISNIFLMDGQEHSFRVWSISDWTVSLAYSSLYSHVVTSYDTSGAASSDGEGTIFKFRLIDDMIDLQTMEGFVRFIFHSKDGSYPDFNVVVKVYSAFPNLANNLLLYPKDQPYNLSWYVYSNTANDINENSEPPTTGTPALPARENSCASLRSVPGKPWRLPTVDELCAIYDKALLLDNGNSGRNFSYYNFPSQYTLSHSKIYYLTNKTNPSNVSQVSLLQFTGVARTQDALSIGDKKFNENNSASIRARCVRDR